MSLIPSPLPLFPLNVVLFPDSRLELHVFEERYRIMIEEVIENQSLFGINLFEKDYLHPIGCAARVLEISRRYADGTFDITVQGIERYSLVDYRTTETGYMLGNVRKYTELPAKTSEDAVLKAIALYNSLMEILYERQHEPQAFPSESDRKYLSFHIAEKAGLELKQRQRILEMKTEAKRLDELIHHMEAIIPRVREYKDIQKLVANDGYLPRTKS